MATRIKLPTPILLCLVLIAVVAGGCKKTPPPVTSTPEPPPMEKPAPPAEPVKTQPMKPAVEEEPMKPRSLTAAELNAQGLLKTVYFDFDRYEIRPDQRSTLQNNAAMLKGKLSDFRVVIEGHCDERGTSEYNMTLGDRRANAAKQYLMDLGIPANRIRTVSYGEERPADSGHNETAWARNRRTEFVIEEG